MRILRLLPLPNSTSAARRPTSAAISPAFSSRIAVSVRVG
jgi:hypothetical protein